MIVLFDTFVHDLLNSFLRVIMRRGRHKKAHKACRCEQTGDVVGEGEGLPVVGPEEIKYR